MTENQPTARSPLLVAHLSPQRLPPVTPSNSHSNPNSLETIHFETACRAPQPLISALRGNSHLGLESSQKPPDTAGEFVRGIWRHGFALPGCPISSRFRPNGPRWEFASSIPPNLGWAADEDRVIRRLRLQFTVRRMMVAVATLATLLGGGREGLELWRRSTIYRDMANFYSSSAAELLEAADERREVRGCLAPMPNEPPPSPDRIARMRRSSVYFADKAKEYRKAAARPWLTLRPFAPRL
jgi:hypothetical protein